MKKQTEVITNQGLTNEIRELLGKSRGTRILTSLGIITTVNSVIAYILKSFNFSDPFIAITALVTLIIIALVLYLLLRQTAWLTHFAKMILFVLPILTIIVAGLLIWKMFFQVNLLEEWSNDISREVGKCKREKITTNASEIEKIQDTACVATAIKENEMPPHSPKLARDKLEYDLRAGLLLTANPLISEVFQRRIGIHPQFLGTGIINPSEQTMDYSDVTFPEYLIPNMRERKDNGTDKEGIFTWQLNPKTDYIDQSVKCVLFGGCENIAQKPPDNKNVNDESKKQYNDELAKIKDAILNNESGRIDNPVLVRFHQFDPKKYVGTVGQPEANRVFFLRLRDVWNLTIRQACKASGHSIDESDFTVFIWIYNPSSGSAVPATWGNILKHSEWLENKLP
jgi:hypothetical protein